MIDKFGREINYLRMSVTDHCNMACTYCREDGDKVMTSRKEILSFEEIYRISKLFSELGIKKIRITGGEPLVRKDVAKLIAKINEIPEIEETPLSTNAELLKLKAQELADAGINRINVSLDTLDESNFSDITRGGNLTKVIEGIDEAIKVGMTPVKINAVVTKGVNDQEIENLIDFCMKRNIHIRFIEAMPIGKSGINSMKNHMTKEEIIKRIKEYLPKRLTPIKRKSTDGPAESYSVSGSNTTVGVIGAVSCNFCDACNRIRLTAKGVLVLCLGQEDSLDIKKLLRDGLSDNEIKEKILSAIEKKPERHFFDTDMNNSSLIQMVELGG